MKVSDVMSREVVRVTSVAMLPEVAEAMDRENIGVVPVVDEGKLRGVVTDRDIAVRAVAKRQIDLAVSEVMTPEPVTIGPDASIDDAIRMMLHHKVRRLLVVDAENLVGVVSLEDLLEGGSHHELLRALDDFHRQTRHR